MIAFYGWTLRFVLRHHWLRWRSQLGTLALTGYLYLQIPKGFFPIQDTGVILGISEGPQDGSFESMRDKQLQLNKLVMEDPAVASLSSFIGIDGTNLTINSGRLQINLKPHEERHESAIEVIRRIQERADQIAGIRLFMQTVQDLSSRHASAAPSSNTHWKRRYRGIEQLDNAIVKATARRTRAARRGQ